MVPAQMWDISDMHLRLAIELGLLLRALPPKVLDALRSRQR